MKSFDLIVGLLYMIGIIFIGIYYANRKFSTQPVLRKNFVLSLCIKVIAAILYGCVYQYYYKIGDSITYNEITKICFDYLLAKPQAIPDFIFLDIDMVSSKYMDLLNNNSLTIDQFMNSSIMVYKCSLVLGFFAGYLYFPSCVLFSLISFLGCWRIYRSMSNLFPMYEKYFKVSFLYIPSIIFWTAGVTKDAICVGFINLFASLIIDAVVFKRHIVRNIILSIFLVYVIFILKSYIVLAFAPLFLYLIYYIQVKKILNKTKKLFVRAVFFMSMAGAMIFFLTNKSVTQSITDEILDNAFHLTIGQQNLASNDDSGYDLGISIDDIKNKNIKPYLIPSIEVALFRPYIWEVKKPIIVLSFIESCFFLLFTVFIFVRGYILNTLRVIYTNKLVLFCILYTLIFSFFVGLVSANFGTLIRYKTPFISYSLIALLVINDNLKKSKKPVITSAVK